MEIWVVRLRENGICQPMFTLSFYSFSNRIPKDLASLEGKLFVFAFLLSYVKECGCSGEPVSMMQRRATLRGWLSKIIK